MNRSRSVTMALAAIAIAGVVVFARSAPTRSAHAQGVQLVRDFYGEANEDVTGAAGVPAGIVCGGVPVGSGLTAQTSEPAEGFTGACLMNRRYGSPLLPSVCLSPTNGTYSSLDTLKPGTPEPSVQCTAPAVSVLQPEWHLGAAGGKVTREDFANNYRVMETCVPHIAGDCASYKNDNCPCDTVPISRSCCTQRGMQMTSADGQTAVGTAYFTFPPNLPVYGN